jgi:hypothetical protein
MKKLALFFAIIAYLSIPFHVYAQKPQEITNYATGAYYVINGVITPKIFKQVESLIAKKFPDLSSESSWFAASNGFQNLISIKNLLAKGTGCLAEAP